MSEAATGCMTASGRLCEVANGRFMALQFAKTLIRLTDRFGDGRLTGVGRECALATACFPATEINGRFPAVSSES